MAAVVYMVVHTPSKGAKTSLICSRTKVSPLKRLTIPRLELTAALLLSKLVKYVHATLKMDIKETYLWTDSQVTLTWIKTLISMEGLCAQQGTINPADCASRGVTTAQLEDHTLWWAGPPWLAQPKDRWPAQPTCSDEQCTTESRPGVSLFITNIKVDYDWDFIYKYSSLNRLLRITALCQVFIRRLRNRHDGPQASHISVADLEQAKIFWIKVTQSTFFAHVLKMLNSQSRLATSHPFSRLTAFIDHQGVARLVPPTDTTWRNATHLGAYQAIILDHRWTCSSKISYLAVCGVCSTKGDSCPSTDGPTTSASGHTLTRIHAYWIDYAGPLTLKTWKGRGAKTHKGWICVFVCLTTSAVHLEVVSDYSTDGFISTYRRFVSRRGIPHSLYSDCGTNFVGAEKSLQTLFTESSQDNRRISSLLAQDRTQWIFNPPAAPHMGGKWEAVVKSLKHHLRRTIGETLLTFEETTTLLAQIEAILNSRPLEPLSDDSDDISALTPGHFLIGSALTSVPEPSLKDLATSRLSRWQFIQQRVQQFWSQWSAQYLQRQQAISKWHHPSNAIQVGSLVLITDERLPPCKWPLARVSTLMPAKDGLTRVVTLKTPTTTLIRPITKLAPLPIAHQAQHP
ncbi:PREDICTED: uncharacterized protein LOC105556482 [Vollenhovia emeryi]|uniref:uncharacterized protein LOC105556482 n=1 Tax=Vollenhovia emeryi TaxID=411798 RepID=UPI0005F3EC65|nr:PREDICTED: uncharacterized protein LOC105556482 [Vollenhovia emeryi]